jgi:hypothetical protein
VVNYFFVGLEEKIHINPSGWGLNLIGLVLLHGPILCAERKKEDIMCVFNKLV